MMTDLDYIVTKNRVEILLLKAQENLNDGKVSKSKLEAVEVLQSALKLIINQNFLIDHYKKEVINIKLQNVKAYKDNTILKNKLKNG
tara:strand:- start:700 stop:960 length:261 start_codon:yes stop_codon:yes gene_type:complete